MARNILTRLRNTLTSPVRNRLRPLARMNCERLEDRTVPALFTVGSAQFFSGLNNNGFVASGDWDGDGKQDIVVTNYGDGTAAGAGQTITFLYGKGDGTFGSPVSLPVGGSADSVSFLAIGDLNNDGHPDIVTVQTDQGTEAGTLTVFLGSEVGAFTKAKVYSTGSSRPSWVGIADLTGTGKQDVVVTHIGNSKTASGRNITVFKGNGTGELELFNTINIPLADGVPMAAAIAKIDADNIPDLAVTFATVPPDDTSPQTPGVVRIYTGNGDRSFTETGTFESGGPLPVAIVAADMDGNGSTDLVVANVGDPDVPNFYLNFGKGTSVGVLRNNGTGSFGPTLQLTTGLKSAFAVAVADFNLNGKMDIAVANYGTPLGIPGGAVVFLGKTSGGFGFTADANSPYSVGKAGTQFLVVDNFDSNPTPDIVLVGDYNRIYTLLNTTVAQAGSTTSLTVAPSPSEFKQTVTLTATVSPANGTGTPTGNVSFFSGSNLLGTATLDAGGVATFKTADLTVGSHTLHAKYAGDATFSASEKSITHQVDPATTQTVLVVDPTTTTFGQTVTFTATVSSAAGPPTGTVNFIDKTTSTTLGSATLVEVSGQQVAVFSTSELNAGTYQVVALYKGSTNFAPSQGGPVTLQIDPAGTSVTIVAVNPTPSTFGQEVALSATVTSPAGLPSGTVAFFDGVVEIGTGTLANGVATFKTASLPVGSYSFTAKYLGNANFAASTSPAATNHTVIQDTTTVVAFTANPNPSRVTELVTFTAEVGATFSAPTGRVDFIDQATGTKLGSGDLKAVNGQQVATFTTNTLAIGSYTIVAEYVPNTTGYAPSSKSITHQVTQIGTTVTISAAPNPSQFNQQVTITAAVAADLGSPPNGGQVAFFRDGVQIGTGLVAADGKATFTTTTLPVGTWSLTAQYLGDGGNYAQSPISKAVTHTVNKTTTTITSASANPTPSLATQLVTFTAVVGADFGTPTGTVAFFANGVQIGSGELATVNGQQVATFATAELGVGTFTIAAKYLGTNDYAASNEFTFSHTVNLIGTKVAISAAPNPAKFGQTVTITATVTADLGTPTGQVNFFAGTNLLGSASLVTINGQQVATFTSSNLPVGSHNLTAEFVASGHFAGNKSQPFTLAVEPTATTITVTANPNPSVLNQAVTFTAVVGAEFGTPTGEVAFFSGGVQIGTGNLSNVNGQQVATFTTANLTLGSHMITARYLGSAGHMPTESQVTHLVNPIGTTVTISASPSPSVFGQAVTFTAVVGANSGTPTGLVSFFNNGMQIGTGNLATLNGQQVATFTTAGLNAGMHTITAKYLGAIGFSESTSNPFSHTVNPASTTITITVAPVAATIGQPVTLTATVSSPAGFPTGTVNFFNGGVQIGTGNLATLNGQQVATFTTTELPLGTHDLSAKYVGSDNFAGSQTSPVTVTVSPASTTVALTSSNNATVFGQEVTFRAVVGASFGTATGTVDFFAGDSLLGTGTLATVNGQQVATFTTSGLNAGSYTITAKYLGTSGFTASTSNALIQTVSPAPTAITMTVAPLTVTAGQLVTLSATVSSPAGTPTGLVEFFDGTTPIGSAPLTTVNGQQVATFSTANLAVGSHALTARFPASGNFITSQTSPVTVVVNPIGTSVTLSTSAPQTIFSQPVTFTATVASSEGTPTGTVDFMAGTTVLGSAPLVTIAGQQVAVFTTSDLSVGSYFVTAKFVGTGGFASTTSAGVVHAVTQVPTTIHVTADPTPVNLGQPVTFTVRVDATPEVDLVPDGTVTLRIGDLVLGTAELTNGQAVFTTSELPAGPSIVSVTYGGDTVMAGGTSKVAVEVTSPQALPREFGVGAGAGHPAIARFFNPDGSERYTIDVFPGFTGGVRVTSADFNGDGIADLVAGSGPGSPSVVVVLDGVTKAELFRINPFEPTFTGGVYVSAGDLTGDGIPDLVISPDEGGGPRVRVFSGGNNFAQVIDFFGIDDPDFRGGARTAVGDVNGDGVGDLVVAAGFLGGPRVAGYSGLSLAAGAPTKVFHDFFAFEQTLRNGVFIAVGDLTGDGKAEVIAGGGPGGGPRITAFSAEALSRNEYVPVANFFGGNPDNRGGIRLVARDLDGDDLADLVVGDGTDAGSRVTGYLGKTIRLGVTPPEVFAFDAYPGFTGGVYVG
jgi:hypothetical protein